MKGKDPVLVTDADALALSREQDLSSRSYVDEKGREVSGETVVRSLEEGVRDTSKLKIEEPETYASGSGKTGPVDLMNRAASSFFEYKIIGKLLKSDKSIFRKGLTAAAVAGLQHFNILPTSVYPLVGAASNLAGTMLGGTAADLIEKAGSFVPKPETEDTSLLTGVMTGTINATSGFAGWVRRGLTGEETEEEQAFGHVTEGSDFSERDAGDVTIATAEDRVRAIYANVFGEDAPDIRTSDPDKIKSYMAANGKLMAEDGVFATCANKATSDREFAGMRAMTAAACAMISDSASGVFGKGKAADGLMSVAEGLAAYEAGAREGFAETYPDGAEKAEEGLAKVMAASRGPVADAVRELQDQYGLFTEGEMARLEELIPELRDDGGLGLDLSADQDYGDAYMPDESVLTAHLEQSQAADGGFGSFRSARTGLDLSGLEQAEASADRDGPER